MRRMRLDLHTHTAAHSTDSNVTPLDLVRSAAQRGLDGLVLTEHDLVWSPQRLRALQAETPLLILPGLEVTTEMGHVLVFGLEAFEPRISDARRLRAFCDDHAALMYLAHPWRDPSLRPPPGALAELFDGVEGINGADGPLQNQAAAAAGGTCRLPPIGGSDSHALHEVGVAATEFDAALRTLEDLVRALRAGAYRAVRLQPPRGQ